MYIYIGEDSKGRGSDGEKGKIKQTKISIERIVI